MTEITILKETNEIQTYNSKLGHYVVYGYGQKEKFLAEVENAENYVNEIYWNIIPKIEEL